MKLAMRPCYALLFASIALHCTATTASAWSGGPFSNNSPLRSGTDGTYKLSVTGKNLSGVARFASDSVGDGGGSFSIFHEGLVATGNTAAFIDHERKKVFGVFNSSALTGEWDARIKSTGRSFLFEGRGVIQSSRSGSIPTFTSGVSSIIVNPGTGAVTVIPIVRPGDPIPLFTKIKVRGTRTSTRIV
jgi:hypothetical protein